MSAPDVLGRFLWHELLTTDPTAAATFYARTTGWKTERWPDNTEYRMFAARSGPVAGYLMLSNEAKAMGAPPSWLGYVGTTDLDATLRLALDLGARALGEVQTVPGVGRMVTLQDPQGAVFAAYQPEGTPPPFQAMPGIGEFAWHELATTDPEAALKFYGRLFGWEQTEAMDMGPALGVYHLYGWGKQAIGGMYKKPADMPAPSHWLPYVNVASAHTVAKALPNEGARILHGPHQVPGGGWIVMAIDPQGAAFAVVSNEGAAPAAAKPAKATAKGKAAPKKAAPRKKAAAKKKAAKRTTKKKAAKRRAAPKRVAKKKSARRKAAPRRAAKKKVAKRRAAPRRAAKKKSAKKRGRRR